MVRCNLKMIELESQKKTKNIKKREQIEKQDDIHGLCKARWTVEKLNCE